MKTRFLLLVLLGCINSATLFSQMLTLGFTQFPPLTAKAGNNAVITSGQSVTLGGNPAAIQGNGGYLYLWSPVTGLDDPTKANPKASPVISTIYKLTVTDSKNCTAQDEVIVAVQSSGTDIKTETPDFKVYPNPSYGNLHFDIDGFEGQFTLRLINSTGVVVHQENVDQGRSWNEDFDTRNLPKGGYYVIVLYKDQVITRPVIIL